MAKKNFDKGKKEVKGYHSFVLGGHTIRIKPGFPPRGIVASVSSDQPAIQGIMDFVRRMIIKEDRHLWDEILDGDSPVFVEMSEVIEVSNWILETISGRPTTSSRRSATGRKATSATSAGTPSGEATTGSD